MRYTTSKKHDKQYGKHLFILMLSVLILIVICLFILRPPEFKRCNKDEVGAQCACPAEEKYIGKRNIIFVDVTDSMSKGKVQDIGRLISETSFREMNLLEWISGDKKVEKTSVYLLADKKPVDMEPIGSYCSLPPPITWLASSFSGNEKKKIVDSARKDVFNAIDKINAQNSVTYSHIVEGLAVSTSNSSTWSSGSKLILISDLYENSETCGYFETQTIPSYKNVGTQCKKWVEILGQNLTKNIGQNTKSTVAICQILSKKPKEGLIGFWRELFQSQLNYDVVLSCDPEEINQRVKSMN